MGKEALTVLDFVGQVHQRYSFEDRFKGAVAGELTKERDNLKKKAGDLQKYNQALEQDVEKKQLESVKLKEKTTIFFCSIYLKLSNRP